MWMFKCPYWEDWTHFIQVCSLCVRPALFKLVSSFSASLWKQCFTTQLWRINHFCQIVGVSSNSTNRCGKYLEIWLWRSSCHWTPGLQPCVNCRVHLSHACITPSTTMLCDLKYASTAGNKVHMPSLPPSTALVWGGWPQNPLIKSPEDEEGHK